MSWVRAVAALRASRTPGVLVTVSAVRGHAPREAGAKLVVSAERTWGSVGGGNLEETAIERARAMLASGALASAEPESVVSSLSDKARTDHGRQCCGGEVTLLLEPLPVVPAVAVFGLGHVGLELARLLSRHDLDLHFVDSRATQVDAVRDHPALADAVAEVQAHHAPLPEVALGALPRGSHVLVLTHDHAEDFALCDAALRMPGHLASVGVIGSSAKWTRFERGLLLEGHDPATVATIRCPIGQPGGLGGKAPAVIALGVVADLLGVLALDGSVR
ncbi:xanthine dehydrogenase accessory protein XdhC [Nocardioides marinquilinus]|uniref:Xanthine dehydrogenase accessory protein XdhC n=1 Tax=Nocardioides marinquilinus TaxID=1210400 RepID=A0ABP9PLY4_9ACTN